MAMRGSIKMAASGRWNRNAEVNGEQWPSKRWNLERLRSESSYWRSCILITAAHLDLFGWIGKQEKSPRALAAHFGGQCSGVGDVSQCALRHGLDAEARQKNLRNSRFCFASS